MPSAKRKEIESKSFSIYKKTWLILKDLEHSYIQQGEPNKPLKVIVHNAIEAYSENEKKRLRKRSESSKS